METSDGFTPIIAIFYAVFHPVEGTKIINQVPENTINNTKTSLFNFNTIKNYIIPKPQLCNKLISIKVGKYKVVGFPVNIDNENYLRNSFNFNLCFVFSYNSDTITYELTIKRIGKMFKVLEEQNYLLSRLNSEFFKSEHINQINLRAEIPGFQNFKRITLSSIESLINQIYQDLNNYSECCIPLDDSNSVDIKLFPILPSPLNIKAFQVPILMVNLNSLVDVNWDPTMLKILPYINGINSIKRISDLSNSDYLLTKQCIQHLMHYKCLQIIDIFQFSNIYAATNNIDNFLRIPGLSERCQSYIINYDLSPPNKPNISGALGNSAKDDLNGIKPSISVSPINKKDLNYNIKIPNKTLLFYLYRSLNQGQTLKQWYIQHKKHLKYIDIRRFINFGLLNGLIYRVNSYPVLNLIINSIENRNDKIDNLVESLTRKASISSGDINGTPSTDTEGHTSNQPHLQDSQTSTTKHNIRSLVHESNLTTNRRKISFNYDRFDRSLNLDDTDDQSVITSDGEIVIDEPEITHHERDDLLKLVKLLKGFQNIDSICTEMQRSRNEIETMLTKLGSHGFINC